MESIKKILRTPSAFVLILVAMLSLIGVLIKSKSDETIARMPIDATLTAEAKLTLAAQKHFAPTSAATLSAFSITSTPEANLAGPEHSKSPRAPTEVANWAVSFGYNFPSLFWTVGAHQYTISSDCSSFPELNGIWSHSFQVSESATQFSTPIYLRFIGLRTEPLGTTSTTVYTIHPAQSTTAIFSVTDLTNTKMNKILADCSVSINWDDGPQNSLIARDPFQWP